MPGSVSPFVSPLAIGMAQRLQAYLHKNRVGTFMFRWRPPKAARAWFDRPAYEFSLGTKDRGAAWLRAAAAAVMVQRLLAKLGTMPKPKDNELFRIDLVRSFTFADGSAESVDYDPANPAEAQEAERVIGEIRARQALVTAPPSPTTVPSPAASAGTDITISAAFRQYCDEKKQAEAWKDPITAEKYDHGPVVAVLIKLIGDKPMGQLSAEDLRTFRKRILEDSGAPANKNKKLQRLGAFLTWAREQHEYTKLSTALLTSVKVGKPRHYEPFSNEDLTRLFESSPYKEQGFREANHFWIPLLGLYTGARINELAQLHVDDIAIQDDIDIIRIDDEDYKRTKTDASVRTIPIHSSLIEAGLLDYVKAIRAEGWTRLFPELSWEPKSAYGRGPSGDFTAYRRACDVSPDKNRVKVFHSFRATANSVLRYKNVPQERRERLVGHESGDINNQAYRPTDRDEMFPMAVLREDIEKLSFDLRHPQYVALDRHHEARINAARRRKRRKASEAQDEAALKCFFQW